MKLTSKKENNLVQNVLETSFSYKDRNSSSYILAQFVQYKISVLICNFL